MTACTLIFFSVRREAETSNAKGVGGASGEERRRSIAAALNKNSESSLLLHPSLGFGAAVTTGHLFYGMIGSDKRAEIALHGPAVTRGER